MKRFLDFLKKKTPLTSRAAQEFDTARRRERGSDYDKALASYTQVADLYDQAEDAGARILFRDMLKAGISCVKAGRNERALYWLNPVINAGKFLSEARLHAGYAFAKLDRADEAASHWEAYPGDPVQGIISTALKEEAAAIRNGKPLQEACEAVATAWNKQDQHDRRTENMKFKRNELIKRRGF